MEDQVLSRRKKYCFLAHFAVERGDGMSTILSYDEAIASLAKLMLIDSSGKAI